MFLVNPVPFRRIRSPLRDLPVNQRTFRLRNFRGGRVMRGLTGQIDFAIEGFALQGCALKWGALKSRRCLGWDGRGLESLGGLSCW